MVRPQTVAEVAKSRGGIAPTAQNMGSLAIKFRANAAATKEAGGVTASQKRDKAIMADRVGTFGGRGGGNTALKAFQEKYWDAREVWAGDKGAYSGITPSGSEASHGGGQRRNSPGSSGHTQSTKKPGSRQSARGLGSAQAPRSGYGLF